MATRHSIAERYTRALPATLETSPQVQSDMWKRWLYNLPAVFVTYSVAYLDRANYGFGAVAGMAATLHISNARSASLGALFLLGYFLFQIPGAFYARRKRATLVVFFALISWDILAALSDCH